MILFFDDERQNNLEYLDELKLSGQNVEYRKDVNVAFNYLMETLPDVELLILDIMMPSGTLFKEEDTNGGLRTGIRFYEAVRRIAPELPVLILTNVSDSLVKERFENEHLCWFRRKENCLPFELVNEVNKILSEISSQSPVENSDQ